MVVVVLVRILFFLFMFSRRLHRHGTIERARTRNRKKSTRWLKRWLTRWLTNKCPQIKFQNVTRFSAPWGFSPFQDNPNAFGKTSSYSNLL